MTNPFDIPFDGCNVIKTTFDRLRRFERFFTEDGRGYSKDGPTTCIDDYSLRPIVIEWDHEVFVKE